MNKGILSLFKNYFYLLVILSFTSQGYAEDQNQSTVDDKNFDKIVREYLHQEKYQEAFKMLTDIISKYNDSEAQCLLGIFYLQVENNPALGTHWLEKAALQSHAKAQEFLGLLYLDGLMEVPQDKKKGLYWLEKASEQNLAMAQGAMGVSYYRDKNYEQALKWLNKAAEQNDTMAQYHLGMMYCAGFGVSQNYRLAFEYFERAALKGDINAQLELGIMYEKGEGTPKNYEQASYWYNKSAEQK